MKLSDLLMENPGEVKVRRTSWEKDQFFMLPAEGDPEFDRHGFCTLIRPEVRAADDWEKVE